MKRLALLCEVLRPPLDEGVRIVSARLAVALARKVEVALAAQESSQVEGMAVHGVLGDRWFRGGALGSFLKGFGPDGILYVPWTSLTARTFLRVRALKARRPGAPVGVLGLQPRGSGLLVRFLSRAGRPSRVFAMGPEVERDARLLGLPVCRLEGGVDTERFRPLGADSREEIRRRLGLPASDYVVLHVGHLKRGRGVMSLPAAQALEGVQVVLVASTSTEQDVSLRMRLQAAGVRVVDQFVESIQDYYRAADCYLFPVRSSIDSIELPLSVLEAMACNLPVVTTRFGGLPELLDGRGAGARLVSSMEEIPRAVTRMKKDRPVPDHRSLVKDLTWDAMAGRILDCLS